MAKPNIASREQLVEALRIALQLRHRYPQRAEDKRVCEVCDHGPTRDWVRVEGSSVCRKCAVTYVETVLERA